MGERVITLAEALNEALDQEMARDPRVLVMGEDVGFMEGSKGLLRGSTRSTALRGLGIHRSLRAASSALP